LISANASDSCKWKLDAECGPVLINAFSAGCVAQASRRSRAGLRSTSPPVADVHFPKDPPVICDPLGGRARAKRSRGTTIRALRRLRQACQLLEEIEIGCVSNRMSRSSHRYIRRPDSLRPLPGRASATPTKRIQATLEEPPRQGYARMDDPPLIAAFPPHERLAGTVRLVGNGLNPRHPRHQLPLHTPNPSMKFFDKMSQKECRATRRWFWAVRVYCRNGGSRRFELSRKRLRQ
jgi:hypothetical protein